MQGESTIGAKPYSTEGANKFQEALEGAASFVPVLGQALAAKDYYKAMQDNDTVGGIMAAAQLIPGVGAINKAGSIMKPSRHALDAMKRGGLPKKVVAGTIENSNKVNRTANVGQAGWSISK